MKWQLIQRIKDGHRWYLNENGRRACADDSGRTPEDTDDGILYADLSRPVRVERSEVGSWISVPLVSPSGHQSWTGEPTTAEAVRFLRESGFRFEIAEDLRALASELLAAAVCSS